MLGKPLVLAARVQVRIASSEAAHRLLHEGREPLRGCEAEQAQQKLEVVAGS
jgi:hypothetical protein